MFGPRVRKTPRRRKWQPTTVFLPKKSLGQRSLVGYSPKELQRVGQAQISLSSGLSHALSFISFYLPQTQPSCISLGSSGGGVMCTLSLSFLHPSLCTWLCSLLPASSPIYLITLLPWEEWEKPSVVHGTLHIPCHSSLPGHLACVSFSPKKKAAFFWRQKTAFSSGDKKTAFSGA